MVGKGLGGRWDLGSGPAQLKKALVEQGLRFQTRVPRKGLGRGAGLKLQTHVVRGVPLGQRFRPGIPAVSPGPSGGEMLAAFPSNPLKVFSLPC